MFAWLTRIFSGGEPQRAAARAVTSTSPANTNAGKAAAAKPAAKPAVKPVEQTFLHKLGVELGELPVLTPSEEQETSALVEDISYYVGTHRIDPPVMPALATRMLELLREDDVDVHALARLIEKDQATAAKLLSIANSAVFKGSGEISGLRDAIVFLGTEQVAQIAVGLASRALFDGPKQAGAGAPRYERLFHHAMTTAFAACQIATRRNRRHSEPAFLGGLFHDVGKAVALRAISEMTANKGAVMPNDQVIDSALHLIHGDPNAVLYESWKLPKQMMLMCQHHHRLPAEPDAELHVVRLVSALDILRRGVPAEKRDALTEVGESAAALNMADAELRAADRETSEFAERVKAMF